MRCIDCALAVERQSGGSAAKGTDVIDEAQ